MPVRGLLTVDTECLVCKGKGFREFKELKPGSVLRAGGKNTMITRRVPCACMKVMTLKDFMTEVRERYGES